MTGGGSTAMARGIAGAIAERLAAGHRRVQRSTGDTGPAEASSATPKSTDGGNQVITVITQLVRPAVAGLRDVLQAELLPATR